MALLDFAPARAHGTAATTIRARLSQAFGMIADWNDARRTRQILGQLSAHELDDIGLTRSDIDAIARGARF